MKKNYFEAFVITEILYLLCSMLLGEFLAKFVTNETNATIAEWSVFAIITLINLACSIGLYVKETERYE